MDGLRYRFFIGGQSHQILRFLEAFDEELRPHFQEAGITEAEGSVAKRQELTFKTTATADAGASTFIGGLVLFALAWAGNQVLDELFEEKFKESLRKFIDKARNNIPLNRKETIEYRSILCRPGEFPTVVVRMIVSEDDTLAELANSIKAAHENAENWIVKNGKQAAIHCYTVSNGQCNLEPVLLKNIKELGERKRRTIVRQWQ
jgi:hypothetical protein